MKAMEWGDYPLTPEKATHLQIGDLHCWIISNEKQVHMTSIHQANNDGVGFGDQPPETDQWDCWTMKEGINTIRLTPILPDLSVVVKPEMTIRLLPDVAVKIYIQVPVWVRFEAEQGKNRIPLTERPSIVLSSTWFGDFAGGELCYWVTSGVQFQANTENEPLHMAVCPVNLLNKSDSELEITRLKIRVGSLTLFREQQQLWSDDIQIIYKGESDLSQIKVSGKPPSEASNTELIAKPRDGGKKSFTSRTFTSLLNISRTALS